MMKVSKEDMVALLAAVERYVRLDHQAEWREWERRLGVIEQAVKDIATLQCERIVPPMLAEPGRFAKFTRASWRSVAPRA